MHVNETKMPKLSVRDIFMWNPPGNDCTTGTLISKQHSVPTVLGASLGTTWALQMFWNTTETNMPKLNVRDIFMWNTPGNDCTTGTLISKSVAYQLFLELVWGITWTVQMFLEHDDLSKTTGWTY